MIDSNLFDLIVEQFDLTQTGDTASGDCPKCGYKNSFSLKKRTDGGILVYCHACQYPSLYKFVIDAVNNHDNGDNHDSERHEAKANCEPTESQLKQRGYAKTIFDNAEPPEKTAAEYYINFRGIKTEQGIPKSIRFREFLPDKNKNPHPAMVAKVTDWSGEFMGIHRTYLRKDGKGKANIKRPKLILGPIKGGSVHFAPAGEVLGLCEGIETGLVVMQQTGIPVWACTSTSGLQNIILPPYPLAQKVIIFADHDPPGLNAAHKLARRLIFEGREVEIRMPSVEGTDFADLTEGDNDERE